MQKKIFIGGENEYSRAYYGWQDGDLALFGLKEGYKNSADDLINVALVKGAKGDIKTLDTYIFPILFCYRCRRDGVADIIFIVIIMLSITPSLRHSKSMPQYKGCQGDVSIDTSVKREVK
ncbi:MAG: hypothetical protein ACOY35_00010 [Bacillota bacterium]